MATLVEQALPVLKSEKMEYGHNEPIPAAIPAGRNFPRITNAEIFELLDLEEGRFAQVPPDQSSFCVPCAPVVVPARMILDV